MITLYGWLPSSTASSTPVTVTVCGAFQFMEVKVTLGGSTVPSDGFELERAMVTVSVG